MPDFDPKTIPTLDDVIEPVVDEYSEKENSDNEAESLVVENEPIIFSAEPVIDFTDEPDIEDAELEPEASFDLAKKEDDESESNLKDALPDLINEEAPEDFESALIDYNAEEPISSAETEPLSEELKIDELPVTAPSPTLISETDLQSISDEIVLQLMPELEQHLRVLVRQTLEQKLPSEIIQFDSSSTTNIDD